MYLKSSISNHFQVFNVNGGNSDRQIVGIKRFLKIVVVLLRRKHVKSLLFILVHAGKGIIFSSQN